MNTETAAPPPAVVNGHAVALAEPANLLPMPVQVEQVVARVKAVKAIVSQVFENGNHFGEIPGTAKNKDGSAKMVLLKPGFDALCLAFQFAPEFIKQPESVESDKFINIVYKCRIIHNPTGKVIATGDGSCNSKEEKYRWTKAARTCPQCKGEFIRTSKPEDQQGFYCWKKIGGCGATFPKRAPEIESQEEGRKENDNPWNFHNTLTKMAQKRAGMAAIITACGLSSDFTQDMEDFEPPANDKSKRDESDLPPVDIQANRSPERPYYQEDEYASFSPANPQSLPDSIPDFTPVDPAFPADILKARESVLKELAHCKTKEDFQRLKAHMQASGAAHLDARVTILVNEAYAKTFPAKSKGAQS